MLTILVQPVLKCMHLLHTTVVLILTASYHVGRIIFLLFIKACYIVRDILNIFTIIGEDLYRFLCELNNSIVAASTYVRSSTDAGINCVLEAVGVFMKHMAKFFVNTHLHSKLLATNLGRVLEDFLNLVRNALLLIADCAWWLITIVPRWLLYAIIVAGDFIVESITSIWTALLYTTQIILDDVFRLTISILLVLLLWRNRRRLCLVILRSILKVKRFVISWCIYLISLIRRAYIIRHRQSRTTPMINLGILRYSPLPRTEFFPATTKILDPQQRCVICKDRQKRVLLLPCRHLCLCDECADHMILSVQRQNCPLCRTFIDNSLSVYI